MSRSSGTSVPAPHSPRSATFDGPISRADLHVHSKFSDRPSEWILRRIGSPESFVEPLEVYRVAKARGLDFVTISDHNCISGALEISHLPGTFISTEVTTYFPEDNCKIHCLVSGITERQFEQIEEVRKNIYEFRALLEREDIIHSVAHPLFRVNNRLSPAHYEKLILLFHRFEAINGTRDRRACEISNAILSQVTPDDIERLANTHDLEPYGETPWIKSFTGGSDDHSGKYIGQAFTETPACDTVEEYLDHIRAQRHREGGEHGTSLLLAHCFYQIGYGYYKKKVLGQDANGNTLIAELFQRMVDGPKPPPKPKRTRLFRGIDRLRSRISAARRFRNLNEVERNLVQEFQVLMRTATEEGRDPEYLWDDRATFKLASDLTHQLSFSFMRRFYDNLRAGRLIDSLQTFASLGPVGLSIAPYIASFKTQHKDEAFLQEMARSFPAAKDRVLKSDRRAWLTDTITDVNGVTTTIRTLGGMAQRNGAPITVLTSVADPGETDLDIKNFKPIGEFRVPEYENQLVAFPPFLEMFEYIERHGFSELLISTPGPVGLSGLVAANLLGLRKVGIYHTDFPEYVRQLTDDRGLESLTWRYMVWFYDQMDVIVCPSQATKNRLLRRGISEEKLVVVGRGVDTARFNPVKRNSRYWSTYGLNGSFKYLYVGRVSKEKNLQALLESFSALRKESKDAELVVVGHGPALESYRKEFSREGIIFTGALHGDDLAEAYASADVFVFPSLTDTYGNAVLEAHASGLPAIVLDEGGPPEIVRRFESGIIVDPEAPDGLLDAMRSLLRNPELVDRYRRKALDGAKASTWEKVYTEFVSVSERKPTPTA